MKYKQLISFNPITTVIQLTDANDVTEEEKLVRSYVMSDEMEKRISDIMLGQLQFEEYKLSRVRSMLMSITCAMLLCFPKSKAKPPKGYSLDFQAALSLSRISCTF